MQEIFIPEEAIHMMASLGITTYVVPEPTVMTDKDIELSQWNTEKIKKIEFGGEEIILDKAIPEPSNFILKKDEVHYKHDAFIFNKKR